ncbi:hypothetical protein CRX72_21565 [Pantoea sp. BRM17]|nr:hypothetical protein CRX72_21565 [Pantoea sp. BRM17]
MILSSGLGVKAFMKGHSQLDENTGRQFGMFTELNWIHNTREYVVRMDGVSVSQNGSRNIAEARVGIDGQDEAGESYRSKGLSASLSTGYVIPLGANARTAFFLQPQARVGWSGIKANDHTERNGTLVQGSGQDNRFGLMAGYGNSKSNTASTITGYRARGQVNGYTTGLYGTWFAQGTDEKGLWADSTLQYSWFNNSVDGVFDTRMNDRQGTWYLDPVTGEEKHTSLWLRTSGDHNRLNAGGGQLSTRANSSVTMLGGDVAATETAAG